MIGECIFWQDSLWWTSFLRFVSFFGDGTLVPVLLVLLVAAYFLFVKRDKIFALVLAIAPLVGQILKSLLKNNFQVPRPEALGCRALTTYNDEFSFPSGHTIFYVIFFGLVTYYYLRRREDRESKIMLGLSLTLILLVGVSRVYLGAHWFIDVLAGYLIGAMLLLLAILVYNRLSKKKEMK